MKLKAKQSKEGGEYINKAKKVIKDLNSALPANSVSLRG